MYNLYMVNANGVEIKLSEHRLLRSAKARMHGMLENRAEEGFGIELVKPTVGSFYHKNFGTQYYKIEKVGK